MPRRTLKVCPTPGCPELVERGGPCPTHQREAEKRRGSARQRGYDTAHERTRARLLPSAHGQPCPRCGLPMLPGQALDLGHSTDRALDPEARADRLEHQGCNRAAGGRLAHELYDGGHP